MALMPLLTVDGVWSDSFEHAGTLIDYRLDQPSWTAGALYLATVGLIGSALLLWIAKRPGPFLLGLALLPLAMAVGVYAHVARDKAGRITLAEAREVRSPASRASVERRLGAPAGHAVAQRGRSRFDCLVYQVVKVVKVVNVVPVVKVVKADRVLVGTNVIFCFAGDRLAFREQSP